MRLFVNAALTAFFFLPSTVLAGPLYGTIREGPNPVKSKQIEVGCPDFNQGAYHVTSRTDDSGSFRLNVEPTGRCMLRLESVAPIAVFSSDKPLRYDFEVVQGKTGRELRRH
jgi:hypothetical protein